MDGQADTAPVSFDDVAQLLIENPDGADDQQEEVQNAEGSDEDNPDAEDSPAEDDAEESDESSEPEKQTSVEKHKLTVKGEDGADVTLEVTTDELKAGFLRHSDYTRKTQDLSKREADAVEFVKAKVGEARQSYQQQAQMAQAAVLQLAGLKTPEEMLALSQTDPAAFVQEQARAQHIHGVLNSLNQRVAMSQQEQIQQQQQEQQAAFSRCWGVLGNKGIDKPKLQHIFAEVSKGYDVPPERFANLNDPALVLIMRDAVAYRELQAKAGEAKKKAEQAPRLPQRQNAPKSQRQQAVDRKFKSGRASLKDLASIL